MTVASGVREVQVVAGLLSRDGVPHVSMTCTGGMWEVCIYVRAVRHEYVRVLGVVPEGDRDGFAAGVIAARSGSLVNALNLGVSRARLVLADVGDV